MVLPRIFSFVSLAASALLFLLAIREYARDHDLLAQRVVEYVSPDVPPEFQEEISYQLDKHREIQSETFSADGKQFYRRKHQRFWVECLDCFLQDARLADDEPAVWLDENYPHHYQWPSNLVAQAPVDGWNACQSQLRAALEDREEDELRSMIVSELERRRTTNTLAYATLGTMALCSALMALFSKKQTTEQSNAPKSPS